jgi:ABC-type polysaccharide/polyol phosphate export permease
MNARTAGALRPPPKPGFVFAVFDLARVIARPSSWVTLGLADIAFRYRRTVIGPFWMTLSTAALVVAVGLIYAGLFRAPIADFVPYLSVGFIVWGYINVGLNEGSNVFIQSQSIIKSTPQPLMTHVMRMMLRNLVVIAHHAVIVVGLWLYFRKPMVPEMALAIPAFLLLTLFLFGSALMLGVLCTRFRDVPQVLLSVLQVLFLVTPIMWRAEDVRYGRFVLDYNPFFYLIEVLRDPLLGRAPSLLEWQVALGVTALVLILGMWSYGKYARRIAYWL